MPNLPDAKLGQKLRRCRESITPLYSQDDLAQCLLSPPDPQVPPFPIGDANALVGVIDVFERTGQWSLAPNLFIRFLHECIVCLAFAGANKRLLKELGLLLIADTFSGEDADFLERYVDVADPEPDDNDEAGPGPNDDGS